ncbi:unnamed protein product [Brassicogethes aeneus]|uniref:BTB domain-containing protein n=1 Tax=Brassicogethes aeneus TaxID=1431903 RepID=A0A9P0FF53_BRAAE|nr:unnamed protein product [Brassicogethes aeneus]
MYKLWSGKSKEMGSEHYCLRWNNHQSNLLGVFSQLLRDESLVDVTLACSEGHSIRAHKVVLSACSSYFQTLFVDHPSRHPIVILKDVRFAELRTLIDFMYKGEVNVEYCQLSALLKTAESLKVKGLAEMTRDYKQEPEQTEPKELVGRRPASSGLQPVHNQLPRPATPLEDMDGGQNSPASSVQNLRVCKSPSERERERDRDRDSLSGKRPPSAEDTSSAECGPSDLVIHNNSTTVSVTGTGSGSVCLPQPPLRTEVSNPTAVICHRPSSPLNCEPLPGPSNMPPVQQVPLSLKKEVDWGGGEEKNSGETSSDYSRHPHDSTLPETDRCVGSPVLDRPSSTQSSRCSTPFALPFHPNIPPGLLEVGLMHPAALLAEEMFRCSSCMAAFPSLWLLEQHTALQHIGSLGEMGKI